MHNTLKGLITYEPYPSEVDWKEVFEFGSLPVLDTTPKDKDTDPFFFAHNLIKRFQGQKLGVLVPGQAFDVFGTRHGRGHGWYDRFLSVLPDAWVRIGVCKEENYTSTPLVRNTWDEPVHMLYIKEPAGTWRVQRVS